MVSCHIDRTSDKKKKPQAYIECAEGGKKTAIQYFETRTSRQLGMRGWLPGKRAVSDSADDATVGSLEPQSNAVVCSLL